MQKKRKSSERNCSERILSILIALIATGLSTGCGGRNLHRKLGDSPKVLVRQWTLPTRSEFQAGDRGFEYSNPALFENTLIFGNQSQGLVSLYPGLQQQRWVLPIPGGVLSELNVHDGQVYFGGGDGFLYSVNAETGRVNWRYNLHNPLVSRPTLHGGRLFVTTSDDTVYALDAGTGKWLWHYRRRTAPPATILGASAPLIEGEEALVGLSDGFLVALSIHEGQLKWERRLHQGTKFTDVDAHPVSDAGVIYAPSYDGALYSLDRKQGEVLWRFDAGGSKQILIEDQKLYLPSTDGSIYALQKASSKVLWKFEMDGGVPTRMILTDRYLIVGSSYQYLYVIDKNTGEGLYRFNAGYDSGFYGSPAYDPAKQRVYILSAAGNLYSFGIRQLERKSWPRGKTDPYEFL